MGGREVRRELGVAEDGVCVSMNVRMCGGVTCGAVECGTGSAVQCGGAVQ